MLVLLECSICARSFERASGEVKRNNRLGRTIYCSRGCAGKGNIQNIPCELHGSPLFLRKGRIADELSPFRQPLRTARKRAMEWGREFDLTLHYLKELWEQQAGVCPYTGWQMYLPCSVGEYNRRCKEENPKKASLDRIDSSQGYIKGNVQFVSHMANVAKNSYSHETMTDFCKAVAVRWSS